MKSFIKMILQFIYRLDYVVLYLYYCMRYQIIDNQVTFLSDSRNDMSGNFEFIYNEIKDNMIIKKHLYATINEKHQKRLLCKDIALSKYILVDDFYPIIYPIPIRKKTKVIQVWHAVGAFKTVGFARHNNHDRFSLTHRNYDAVITSSPQTRKDYAKAFRMDINDVYSVGIPRTDVFFDLHYQHQKRKELYEKYPIIKNKKVILFAPTFRGNNIKEAYYDYDKIDFSQFSKNLKDDYICIIKMHPFIRNKIEFLDSDFYLDLSNEREINDLLFITDILITDYSSVIFEAALLNIQTIFFAYDLQDYISKRDFFYPYSTYTYGPIVDNQKDLEEAIKENKLDENTLHQFKDYFMSSCDGYATKRFVNQFFKEDF